MIEIPGCAGVTVVEDYSLEALACIVDILQERTRRIGACQISSSTIRRILTERFGFSNQVRARSLTKFVIDFFVKQGSLVLWDSKPKCTIYNVKTIY